MSETPVPPPPPAYGAQPYPAPPGNLATWGQRVQAYLFDAGLMMVGAIIMNLSQASSISVDANGMPVVSGPGPMYYLGLLLLLAGFAFFIWSYVIRQGSTGQSFGKSKVGIKVAAENGQPITAGGFVVRWLAHILDGIPCYIGFLWPLWDAKKQTFADKILSTVVVQVPKG